MIAIILISIILYTIILSKTVLNNSKQKNYYRNIPTNDSPALVGKITKGHVDGNDLIATILDLTYKGYIKIEIEKINGKDKRVLYLQKDIRTLDLREYEFFIINQIFKKSNKIVFDDYIKSGNFKQDYKAFDKMMDRRAEIKAMYRKSSIKNINKIIMLTMFSLFGIIIFYSIMLPIVMIISGIFTTNINIKIMVNIFISIFIYLLLFYKYITHVNNTTNTQENIVLYIFYIIMSVIICLIIGFARLENILNLLYREFNWHNICINLIFSSITILYMCNLLRKREDYLYYFFIVIGIIAIIAKLNILMAICIVFFATYIFFKSPNHIKLAKDNYLYKWIGFKNYLEDYSLMTEQEENSMLIWEKYLIYAVSLGVNKKIIKKYGNLNNTVLLDELYLKKFYTEFFE